MDIQRERYIKLLRCVVETIVQLDDSFKYGQSVQQKQNDIQETENEYEDIRQRDGKIQLRKYHG